MHSNNPALLAGTPVNDSVPAANQRFPDSEPSLPACNVNTDPGQCTGVLYKHKGSNGFSYFADTMNVPCSSTTINSTNTSYQGNVYISIGSSQSQSAQLEMGIQYNANGSSNVVSVQPYASADGNHTQFATNAHLTCNQGSMSVQAWVAQASSTAPAYGVMVINGGFSQKYTPSPCGTALNCTAAFTTMAALNASDNLTQVCAGCHVEWTTGLAVPAGGNQILNGSYLGINGCSPTLDWNAVVEGHFSAAGPSATASTSAWPSSTAIQSPSNATTLGLVSVTDRDAADEVIGINEKTGCVSGKVQ